MPAKKIATKTVTARPQTAEDERTRRDAAPNVRGDRGVDEDAQRTGDTSLMSSAELEKLIRDEYDESYLPKPPAIPGWHLCWLTTTSGFDTIAKRKRIGYEPVRMSEVAGFDPSNGQTLANYEGFVTCNEMVLFKLPERVYQTYMKVFHHTKPLDDEKSILAKIKEQSGQADSDGRELSKVEGDGVSELERQVKIASGAAPTFSS